jgi:hypothetical protein
MDIRLNPIQTHKFCGTSFPSLIKLKFCDVTLCYKRLCVLLLNIIQKYRAIIMLRGATKKARACSAVRRISPINIYDHENLEL